MSAFLCLSRLRILRQGRAAYDQEFHMGVNIIRGANGSGKSTIADFIFFVLGGEFDSWKAIPKLCDEVQAELRSNGGLLTVKRAIGSKISPASVFFGAMKDADQHALDGWTHYPLHRTSSQPSYSQILFRACGIPESPSDGVSNITMHQVLRLAYSDQRTPATRVFRFEQWDTHDIREAVGHLVCGLNVHEQYESRVRLRDLKKTFDEKQKQLTLKLAAVPFEEGSATVAAIESRIRQLGDSRAEVITEIAKVDETAVLAQTESFLQARQKAVTSLNRAKRRLATLDDEREKTELELADLEKFSEFLNELLAKLPNAEEASTIVGNVEFAYCPSCLSKLESEGKKGSCIVCGSPSDPAQEQSRYLQIKLDLEIQRRDTQGLIASKQFSRLQVMTEHRKAKAELDRELSKFADAYDVSASPRESYLAERHNKLGRLDQELRYMQRLLEVAIEIDRLSGEKAELQRQMDAVEARLAALEQNGNKRRRIALTAVSDRARALLRSDLPRQDEFADPKSVAISFRDDIMSVDGTMNFAESSNVILKNSCILALFAAATHDADFFHPRFLLLDNVEDKGMEDVRSHNFQSLIVKASAASTTPHQIIFTTSTINPDLERDDLVIGPKYSNERKTLDIGVPGL